MTLLETAFYWRKMGIATIPVQYRDKHPEATLLPKGEDGKGDWITFQTQLPSIEQLKIWFSSRLHNIGIVVGWQGLVVIDFDADAAYTQWRLWVNRQSRFTRFVANNTYQIRSARGWHVYVRLPHTEQNRKLPGIDIKAQRGYVLTAPSIHPSGVAYQEIIPGAQVLSIDALSDILPAQLLIQQAPVMAHVSTPHPPILSDDPWASASAAGDPDARVVEKIRARFKLLDFFPDAIKTSADSRWWMARCPFHDDKSPSFWIDTTRGICACYSGCTTKPLDVVNLYARLYGLTNSDAIFALAKML